MRRVIWASTTPMTAEVMSTALRTHERSRSSETDRGTSGRNNGRMHTGQPPTAGPPGKKPQHLECGAVDSDSSERRTVGHAPPESEEHGADLVVPLLGRGAARDDSQGRPAGLSVEVGPADR